jgi:predicted RNA-binding protein YlxR (DUF448 family)
VALEMEGQRKTDKPGKTRTCAGCGRQSSVASARSEMLRIVVTESEVVFDLAGGAFGRGAYVHPQADCLAKAPRGLLRAFGRGSRPREGEGAGGAAPGERALSGPIDAADLGARLVAACTQRMTGLLMAARRLGAVAIGSEAARDALARGMREIEAKMPNRIPAAPLAIVAADAGSVAQSLEVTRAVAAGRAIAWSSKIELGALLGEEAIAICTVRHESIAAELRRMHAAADAGAAVTR